jgi:hypothetical protein
MKRLFSILLLVLSVLAPAAARSQGQPADTTWTGETWRIISEVDLLLSQSAYSNNWAGSEFGSLNWQLNSNTVAEKRVFSKVFNKNTLKMSIGYTYAQDRVTNAWGSGDKTNDLIDLESTFRYMLGTVFEPIFAFRAITQFVDQTDPEKDRPLNPLDFTESIGLAHTVVKHEDREWQYRVGVAARQFIDRDRLDPVTLKRETFTQYDGGFEFVNDLRWPFADKKVVLVSKLTVFQGVMSTAKNDLKGTPQADDWMYPDVNFENTLTSHITKYLTVMLYVQSLYDRQVDRGLRFKQILSLGLHFKLL